MTKFGMEFNDFIATHEDTLTERGSKEIQME
jgi:hypothetical protein